MFQQGRNYQIITELVTQIQKIFFRACDGLENANLCYLQLVDVYRLLEDQIDVPSVALEVARGKASLNPELDFSLTVFWNGRMRQTKQNFFFVSFVFRLSNSCQGSPTFLERVSFKR